MPCYEYYCEECDQTEERTVHMADRDGYYTCSGCCRPMKRVISPVPHKWDGCEWPGGYRPKGQASE